MANDISHYRDFDHTQQWSDDATALALQALMKQCFSGISPADYFRKYFLSDDYFKRALRIFYAPNESGTADTVVGYCLITFKKQRIGRKRVTLLGASAGFLPDYRSGNNTVPFSIRQALGYWVQHPWETIYYADTMLSPAMYRVMAKNMATIYPHPDHTTPPAVIELWRQLNPKPENPQRPFVLKTGRYADYSEDDLKRFKASEKPEIAFYLRENPNFFKGNAIITVIPINARQMLKMALQKIGL